jgi:hypothetical protein
MNDKTIAVLGASKQRGKFGNKCVRAYLHAGWDVYPVHWTDDEIEGLAVYEKLADVPVELDRISVYLPPPVTMEVLPEIAEKGAREVWFNPGSADSRVLAAARAAGIAAVDGCSIVDVGLSPSQFP